MDENAYELRHKGQITYNIKKGRSKVNSFGSPSNLRKIIRKPSGGSLIQNARVGLTAWKYVMCCILKWRLNSPLNDVLLPYCTWYEM